MNTSLEAVDSSTGLFSSLDNFEQTLLRFTFIDAEDRENAALA